MFKAFNIQKKRLPPGRIKNVTYKFVCGNTLNLMDRITGIKLYSTKMFMGTSIPKTDCRPDILRVYSHAYCNKNYFDLFKLKLTLAKKSTLNDGRRKYRKIVFLTLSLQPAQLA